MKRQCGLMARIGTMDLDYLDPKTAFVPQFLLSELKYSRHIFHKSQQK